ncbi:calcium-binding protein [Pseudohalioglobus sediminis]|uniref:Calcium-binding protein n=1 Tax=Pseudohalioglobus sediminis TaxID=2606449 RepID=A0A5B0WUB7_9GAMM|nr:calcium-binding protein [Pseudohalioglobus sediminis]
MPGYGPIWGINRLFGQQNAIAQFLASAGLDENGVLSKPVKFAGHSLGGFLATAAAYRYHESAGHSYTFNGLGIRADEFISQELINGISLAGKIDNYYADFVGEHLGVQPGARHEIFIESSWAYPDHSIVRLVDSLSVYRILAEIDPSLDSPEGMAKIEQMLSAASHEMDYSLEIALAQIGTALGGDLALPAIQADSQLFYDALVDRGLQHELQSIDPARAADLAAIDDEVGRGYRYALANLTPFVMTSGLEATAAAGPAYDLLDGQGNALYSEAYLHDRAQMLSSLLQRNVDDAYAPERVVGQQIYFHDESFGPLFAGATSEEQAGVSSRSLNGVSNILFGDDTDNLLLGGDLADRVHGGGGADELRGSESNDYLDGGAGDDIITGGAGDDRLIGGAGRDVFQWNTGDGHDLVGDFDDARDSIVVNGTDLASLSFTRSVGDSDFFIDPERSDIRVHYDGSFLTVHFDDGVAAGSVTLTQFQDEAVDNFGITLNEAVATPPVTQVEVAKLGPGTGETDASAYWRQSDAQGGIDWATVALRFDADQVANYSGGNQPYGLLSPRFEGGPVDDHLTGDQGSNQLLGMAGSDLIEGGDGSDYLAGFAGSDILSGGAGNDLLFGNSRYGLQDALQSGSFEDAFYLSQLSASGADSDTLDGGAGDDMLSGSEASDILSGGAGSDYLLGGSGVDQLEGGDGADVLYGDSALGIRYDEAADGSLQGSLQIAFATGADGHFDDVLYGGAGDDTLWGESGNDTLHGGHGDDQLIGDRYHDATYFDAELPAYAGTASALSEAEHGDDRLYGNDGADRLLGLGGDDTLDGGAGQDLLLGGPGNDRYMSAPGGGLDVIEDDQGEHLLVFAGATARDLQITFQDDRVYVTAQASGDGFQLARQQWSQTRLALEDPANVIERSQVDTQYLNANGSLLLSIAGSDAYTEAERDQHFTVDDAATESPVVVTGAAVDEVEVRNREGAAGALVSFPGWAANPLVEVSPLLLLNDWDFLDASDDMVIRLVGFADAEGTGGDNVIHGSAGADELLGMGGDDLLFGEAGNDELDGGIGADTLLGGDGDDILYGGIGHDIDVLEGGAGDDVLDGAYGNDVYRFARGDGRDVIADAQGAHHIAFDASVNPEEIVLHREGASDDRFRIEYANGDWIRSAGAVASDRIAEITVDGAPVSLLQRSDLANGVFYGTHLNDVFETGPGDDLIHLDARGSDVIRVGASDGLDVVILDEGYYPEFIGEVRLDDVDSLEVSFSGIDAQLTYDGGELSLQAEKHFSEAARDNALQRVTLRSGADSTWTPTITASGPGWLHGSFGSDHLIGSDDFDVVTPGYGNDLIETGAGNDSIFLNDVYFRGDGEGIGSKTVLAGAGDDYIETPLYQGLKLVYVLGDGSDHVLYDWSYGERHPYQFSLGANGDSPQFTPHGQDSLEFGPGITLDDLVFARNGNKLHLALMDEPGDIRFDNFLNVYDPADVTERSGLLDPFAGEDGPGYQLSNEDIATLFPRTPIAELVFADGSRSPLAPLLDERMQKNVDIVAGTPLADTLEFSVGGHLVLAYAGDDQISASGGRNTIYAGSGNDTIEVAGQSFVDAGAGNDWVDLHGGELLFQFGPDSGADVLSYLVDASATVQMSASVTPEALTVTRSAGEHGESVRIDIADSDASLELVTLKYNESTNGYFSDWQATSAQVEFVNGDRLAGHQLLALIEDDDVGGGDDDDWEEEGDGAVEIVGTDGKDVLVGTPGDDYFIGGPGNDKLSGEAGDDVFLVEGSSEGFDIFIGGEGWDAILGGEGDDVIGLRRLSLADSIEVIDGGDGVDAILGNQGKNRWNFSNTELFNITALDGGSGADVIKASQGDDTLVGGLGDDLLVGNGGSDTYLFYRGDGVDRIVNKDADADSHDVLSIAGYTPEQLWFSRQDKHLVVDAIGTDDQITLKNWFAGAKHELDAITAGDSRLLSQQVDVLVDAMAAFDIPTGLDAAVSPAVRDELQPTLAAVWESAA